MWARICLLALSVVLVVATAWARSETRVPSVELGGLRFWLPSTTLWNEPVRTGTGLEVRARDGSGGVRLDLVAGEPRAVLEQRRSLWQRLHGLQAGLADADERHGIEVLDLRGDGRVDGRRARLVITAFRAGRGRTVVLVGVSHDDRTRDSILWLRGSVARVETVQDP